MAALLLGIAVALAAPIWLERVGFPVALERWSQEALGRSAGFDSVDVELLSRAVSVRSPFVGSNWDDACMRADSARFAVSPGAWLSAGVAVEEVVLQGAEIRLRAGEGRLSPAGCPVRSRAVRASGPDGEEGASVDAGPRPALRLLAQAAMLRIEFDGINGSAPRTLDLGPVDLALALEPGAPAGNDLVLQATSRPLSGGRIEGTGTLGAESGLSLRFAIHDVAVAPFLAGVAGLLEGTTLPQVAGIASGTLRLSERGRMHAHLTLRDAKIRTDTITLEGDLGVLIRAESEEELGGSIEIDASNAALDYAGAYVKPAGAPASVSATLAVDPEGGFRVDDLQVRIRSESP